MESATCADAKSVPHDAGITEWQQSRLISGGPNAETRKDRNRVSAWQSGSGPDCKSGLGALRQPARAPVLAGHRVRRKAQDSHMASLAQRWGHKAETDRIGPSGAPRKLALPAVTDYEPTAVAVAGYQNRAVGSPRNPVRFSDRDTDRTVTLPAAHTRYCPERVALAC